MIGTIYKCEICGEESDSPVRWIVIHCSDAQLTIFKWTNEAAQAPEENGGLGQRRRG